MTAMDTDQSRMTDRVRRTYALAQKFAREIHHEYIGCEHVVLGLLEDGASVAAYVLQQFVKPAEFQKELKLFLTPGPEMVTIGKLPMTPALKRAYDLSFQIAREYGDSFVGTEHLILAIVREGSSHVAKMLNDRGCTEKEADKLIGGILGKLPEPVLLSEVKQIMHLLMRCKDSIRQLKSNDNAVDLASEHTERAMRWLSEVNGKSNKELAS